jgi:hypothetical protein
VSAHPRVAVNATRPGQDHTSQIINGPSASVPMSRRSVLRISATPSPHIAVGSRDGWRQRRSARRRRCYPAPLAGPTMSCRSDDLLLALLGVRFAWTVTATTIGRDR